MAIGTYGELKTAVSNWLEREDLDARIPEFVALAEVRINQELRTRHNEKRITASISTRYFDIPSNFVEMRNFQLDIDPIQHLDYASPERIDLNYPTSMTGIPRVYTIHGTEFEIRPSPDTSYNMSMTYWYSLDPFVADSDLNATLTNFPNLYLYASLVAAAPFLEGNSNLESWAALYNDMLKKVNTNDKIGRYSGTKLYAKPRHRPE